MNTQTLETTQPQILPYNEIADLMNRDFNTRTLEQFNLLAREYEIENPSEVVAFLSKNKSLLDLLAEIPAQVRKHFGAEQQLLLSFFLDPEDSSAHCLHVRIPTKLKSEAARRLLKGFDEEWWNEREAAANFKIFVNLKFLK